MSADFDFGDSGVDVRARGRDDLALCRSGSDLIVGVTAVAVVGALREALALALRFFDPRCLHMDKVGAKHK